MQRFVRGGQVSLHNMRMFRQICKVMLQAFLLLLALSNMILFKTTITAYQMHCLLWYGLASLYETIGIVGTIYMKSTLGTSIQIASNVLLASPSFLHHVHQALTQIEHNFIWSSAVLLAISMLVTVLFCYRGTRLQRTEIRRGADLCQYQALEKAILNDNKKQHYNAYRLAGIPYPVQGETLHTLIAGSTGSGKTVIISDLLAQIKARGDRAIIYDKMGTFTQRFFTEGQDILLNPFDARCPKWSIFMEVSPSFVNFDNIASAMMPLEKGSNDPFWVKAARTVFSEVCSSLQIKGGGATNHALVKMLLRKNLRAMQYLPDHGTPFSMRDWVGNDQASNHIFITSRGDQHASLMPLISAWIEIAISSLLSQNQTRNRKIWFLVDELPSLHHLPSLEQGLAETRQFGGCFVLGIQSMPQLRNRYGSDGAESISSLCGNRVILRSPDIDTATWCADTIGTIDIDEHREGLSYGAHAMRDGINVHTHSTNKRLVLPSEIMNLGNLEGYIRMVNRYPVAKIQALYQEHPEVAPKFLPAENPVDIEEQEGVEKDIKSADQDRGQVPDAPSMPRAYVNTDILDA